MLFICEHVNEWLIDWIIDSPMQFCRHIKMIIGF